MYKIDTKNILIKYNLDFLLVNSTNEYLCEYSDLSENARYKLTNFSGSTGDALLSKNKIYLFVDGRYHIQADKEVFNNVEVVKLQLGQKQDEEIIKIVGNKKLGIVSKKVSQARLENFKNLSVILLNDDPINNYTEKHSLDYKITDKHDFNKIGTYFITNLEEVSYLTGFRDFSKDFSSKIYAKLFIENGKQILFKQNENYEKFLSEYDREVFIDKNSINAYDYNLIKKPIHKTSEIKLMKSIKTQNEIEAYKKAFECTDKTVLEIRDFINKNDSISEYDIAVKLRNLFIKNGAKNLSFKSIVAINKNSALAHYSSYDKNLILKDGDLILIDCGAYDESGLATDITRVFVKGKPSVLQKRVYTLVLKAFLNTYNSTYKTGFEHDTLAHTILDNKIDGFVFNHGLGHGIGINVHEMPPNLSQNNIAKTEIIENMTYTIEPGLYNKDFFGVRLENSCYRKNGKNISLTNVGYEKKLIDFDLLNKQEIEWLKEFELYEDNQCK